METAEEFQHYNRAPITEAILNFRIEPMPADRFALLEEVKSRLAASYPKWQRLEKGEIALSSFSGADGLAFASEDGKFVVQARLDGFSFSQLAPYDRWATFIDRARMAWDVYSAVAMPSKNIVGFFVRYINEFRLPYETPLHQFFHVYPATPNRDTLFTNLLMITEAAIPEIPGGAHTMFFHPLPESAQNIPDVTSESVLTAASPGTPPTFRMVLDNMFRFNVRDYENAWKIMDEVHRIKNATFESQITDRLKETLA
jgi:uncharacterized protein (TIGR04255 family)